jgi:hypothetical protein
MKIKRTPDYILPLKFKSFFSNVDGGRSTRGVLLSTKNPSNIENCKGALVEAFEQAAHQDDVRVKVQSNQSFDTTINAHTLQIKMTVLNKKKNLAGHHNIDKLLYQISTGEISRNFLPSLQKS